MKITINNFKGKVPKVHPKLLPDNYAQTAENVVLENGKIVALASNLTTATEMNLGALRTIFYASVADNPWVWTYSDVCPVYLQIAAASERIMYTNDDGDSATMPKQSNATLKNGLLPSGSLDYWRKVGIAAPAAALTVEIQGTGTGEVVDTVSYVYTYVAKWADGSEEESPPSPATSAQDVEGDEYVRVKNIVSRVKNYLHNNSITHYRIYRLKTGLSGEAYKHIKSRGTGATETTDFWYDIPVAKISDATTYIYDTDGTATALWDNSADSEIETTDWDNPPTDLSNLVQYQNGILAGTSGRNVCVSVYDVFYAWPSEYQIELEYDPVALAPFNDRLYVLTDTYYYIVTGVDSASLNKSEPIASKRCYSQRGVVRTPLGIMYPCPEGMYLINESGGRVYTKDLVTKEQWAALTPSGKDYTNCFGLCSGYKYYCFFAGSGEGFILHFGEEFPYITTFDFGAGVDVYHGYVRPTDNEIVLLTNKGTDWYYDDAWDQDGDTELEYTWKSKIFVSPRKMRLGAGRLRGTQTTGAGNGATVTVYTSGTQLKNRAGANWSVSVTDEKPFRIPGGALDNEFEVQVQGTAAQIDSIELAGTMDEL